MCATWISRLLSDKYIKQMMGAAFTFIIYQDGAELLDHFVTDDETRVFHKTPEQKR